MKYFQCFFGKGNRSIKKRRFLAAAVTVYIPIKTAQISFEKSCFSCQKEKKNLDDALQEPTHKFKKNLFEQSKANKFKTIVQLYFFLKK